MNEERKEKISDYYLITCFQCIQNNDPITDYALLWRQELTVNMFLIFFSCFYSDCHDGDYDEEEDSEYLPTSSSSESESECGKWLKTAHIYKYYIILQ